MVDLDRMRSAFVLAAAWQGWSAEDQAELGAQIRAVIASDDAEALACWAAYLDQAAGLSHMTALCRAAEVRIRSARKVA